MAIGLESPAIEMGTADVLRNAPPAVLYEHAIARERAAILSCGALATYSGEKTGRSPLDKRIVRKLGKRCGSLVGKRQYPGGRGEFPGLPAGRRSSTSGQAGCVRG